MRELKYLSNFYKILEDSSGIFRNKLKRPCLQVATLRWNWERIRILVGGLAPGKYDASKSMDRILFEIRYSLRTVDCLAPTFSRSDEDGNWDLTQRISQRALSGFKMEKRCCVWETTEKEWNNRCSCKIEVENLEVFPHLYCLWSCQFICFESPSSRRPYCKWV